VLQKNVLPTSIQVQRRASGLPCAMALRLIRDRPGDPAFRDTIPPRKRWLLRELTPASGRRTQTISPYAAARSSRALPRPPLPVPRSRRWPTPLWRNRLAGVVPLICPTGPAKCFSRGDWTGGIAMKSLGKLGPRSRLSSPRKRGSSTPRPLDLIAGVSGILGRPVKPGDDSCVRRQSKAHASSPSASSALAVAPGGTGIGTVS